MTITLEAIEAQHSRISEMIAAFKAQPRATEYRIDAVTIPLAAGERYAGPILNSDGTLSHYLIKLPGEIEDINHGRARESAAERGVSLPTMQEGNLLRANLRGEFADAAYWLDEEYEPNTAYAWSQDFDDGFQDGSLKSAALRAVFVRRFIPSVI